MDGNAAGCLLAHCRKVLRVLGHCNTFLVAGNEYSEGVRQ